MTACVCGHHDYDHLGVGRCDNGSKRCGCSLYRACDHPSLKPWHISRPEPHTRYVCAVCGHVQDIPSTPGWVGVAS